MKSSILRFIACCAVSIPLVLAAAMAHADGGSRRVTLQCDVPHTDTISDPSQTDSHDFGASDGERVGLIIDEIEPSGAYFGIEWRVLRADGTPITGWYTLGYRDLGPLEASGSPYRIEVRDYAQDDTGTYEIHLQRLTAATACEAVPLICDAPVSGPIEDPFDTDLYSFDASDDERVAVIIDEIEPSGASFGPEWRVLRADGSAMTGWYTLNYDDLGPLVASDSPYRIEIRDYAHNDTGIYRIHLQRLTASTACEALALQCDLPVSGLIEDRFDTDLHWFDASDDERVAVIIDETEPSGASFGPEWRVLRADGSAMTGWYTLNYDDLGPLVASDSPYRIEIRDYAHNDTGTYQIHLQRLTAATACEAVPLLCDEPASGPIEDPFDTDLYSFDASDDERVAVIIDEIEPSGASFGPEWRVLRADGSAMTGWYTLNYDDLGPLVASDSPYRIEIRDYAHNDTGTYEIHLQRLTAATACEWQWITPESPVVDGTIEDAFDTDLLNFLPQDGFDVHIEVDEIDPSGSGFYIEWRVVRGDGSAVTGWYTLSSADVGPLTMSETPYRIEIRDYAHSDTGTYRVSMTGITGVDDERLPPTGFLACSAVAPNPVSHGTVIRFALEKPEHATLQVYDLAGRLVATLLDEPRGTGIHEVAWTPGSMASGVYFCRLRLGDESFFARLAVIH
jgi:methionine-rich copper-binding protein CopC